VIPAERQYQGRRQCRSLSASPSLPDTRQCAGDDQVANPSALFLAERRGKIAGSAVFAGLEGIRPVLMEVQALLSANAGGSPRRQVIGWDGGRLKMGSGGRVAQSTIGPGTTQQWNSIAAAPAGSMRCRHSQRTRGLHSPLLYHGSFFPSPEAPRQ